LAHSSKNGQATESEARFGGQTENIAVVYSPMYRCAMNREDRQMVWNRYDIEDRSDLRQALSAKRGVSAEAHRLAKTGSWAYSPAAEKCIYWSDEMRRIFGLILKQATFQIGRVPSTGAPGRSRQFNERIDKAFSERLILCKITGS